MIADGRRPVKGIFIFSSKKVRRADRPGAGRAAKKAKAGSEGAFSPPPALGHAYLAAFSAARRVFFMSIVMVMGPTPPGTGVR